MNTPISQMTDEQLEIELQTLTCFRNGLSNFIPQDHQTRLLINEVNTSLTQVREEVNLRWSRQKVA